MDTRFWGPSGWKLLHSIAFSYKPEKDKAAMKTFFEMLPFVLPCKFCRTSLTGYMQEDPLGPALKSRDSLSRWLWRIHNQVNAKLRGQNLKVEPDPPFETVRRIYMDSLGSGCSRPEFPGWEFLFSVAELHPMSKAARTSIPMKGHPPCSTITCIEEKNKWNCLPPEERLPLYHEFWVSLGSVLPFNEWRVIWLEHGSKSKRSTKKETIQWLWELRCAMENSLDLINRCEYSSLCKNLKAHRSGCNKSKKAKTCRMKRNTRKIKS